MKLIVLTDRTQGECWINVEYIQLIKPDVGGTMIIMRDNILMAKESPSTILHRIGAKGDA